MEILTGLVFVVILYALAVLNHQNTQDRIAALRQLATRLGWSFQDAPPLTIIPHVERFELFTQGRDRKIRNYLAGESGGDQLAVFDYSYATGADNAQKTHSQTVLHVHSPRLDLPLFSLRPENLLHRIGGLVGHQDIDIEGHPAFSGEYLLRGQDESSIRAVFEPDVVAFYEANRGRCTTGAGPDLLLWRSATLATADEVPALLELGRDLLARLTSRALPHPNGPAA
ncbi:MAG TPA: hypothetical protein VGB24_02055 [Longimicrobium sp.]|jgi:hypothetical protein|uniref:hypothetical protein n=1 Tax=Longimicrobium sp. TaxID=2029185 RepID=UPI002ED9AAA4